MRTYYEDFMANNVIDRPTKDAIVDYMAMISKTDACIQSAWSTPILLADVHADAMETMADAVEKLEDEKNVQEGKILIACEKLHVWEVRSYDLWPVLIDRTVRNHEDDMNNIVKQYHKGKAVGEAIMTIACAYEAYDDARRAQCDIIDMMRYANKVYSKCEH